jgi:hypothetical protein
LSVPMVVFWTMLAQWRQTSLILPGSCVVM